MYQLAVPHHTTGAFTSHRKFLADKEYGEALDTLVKACSDLLLQSPDGTKVFIGKRLVHPQPDWWFVGGRIFPGETPVQSCCRLLKRELSLEIEPTRFETVCCQSLAWGMRQQAPMTNGTTDSQVVLSLRLSEAEVEKVVLDPKEYETSMWITPDELLAGHYHPALKFAVASMRASAKLRELQVSAGRIARARAAHTRRAHLTRAPPLPPRAGCHRGAARQRRGDRGARARVCRARQGDAARGHERLSRQVGNAAVRVRRRRQLRVINFLCCAKCCRGSQAPHARSALLARRSLISWRS